MLFYRPEKEGGKPKKDDAEKAREKERRRERRKAEEEAEAEEGWEEVKGGAVMQMVKPHANVHLIGDLIVT